MSFPVVEKFISVNGEGTRAGELAVFIRFRQCNLNCSYCDTKWANIPDAKAEILTADEIVEYVNHTGIINVTLTGGEPLLQKDIYALVEKLIIANHRVEIETNGSIDISAFYDMASRPVFTLDYKLPGSGMEKYMLTNNYKYLSKEDTVKFVSRSRSDLEKAIEIIYKYNLTDKCNIYLSPVFGYVNLAEIVEFMLEKKLNNVRLQLQLHKYIWDPEIRGV